MDQHDEYKIKVVTILCLGAIVWTSVVGITLTGILTDRDLFRAEILSYAGAALLAAVGGVSWWQMRRHRWRVRVDRNGKEEDNDR